MSWRSVTFATPPVLTQDSQGPQTAGSAHATFGGSDIVHKAGENEKGIHHVNVREVGVDRADPVVTKPADRGEVFVESLALALRRVMKRQCQTSLTFEDMY